MKSWSEGSERASGNSQRLRRGCGFSSSIMHRRYYGGYNWTMASALDRGIAQKMAATLNPLLATVSGPVAELCRPQWQGRAPDDLVERLQPDGRPLFVEPVCGIGVANVLQRAFDRAVRARWGYGFSRDMPAELRAAGMTVTSVDRFFVEPVPTVFTFAAADARFY